MTDKKISPIAARAWIGREVEGNNRDLRLFVDSIREGELYEILDKYPDIKAVYFGHIKDDSIDTDVRVIKMFYTRIRIIIEIDIPTLLHLPTDIRGMVEIILRIPNDIRYIKTIIGDSVGVMTLNSMKFNQWNGAKVYKDDKIVLGAEKDDVTIQG
jgi:hypothetical protein